MMDLIETGCPLEITCGGRWFVVTRSLDLARRLEARFGALRPLAERLESGQATSAEIAGVYAVLLAGQSGEPSRDEIDGWLFGYGFEPAARQVMWIVYALTLGNAAAVELYRRIARSTEEARPRRDGQSPFVPTAGSTGRGSSTSVGSSAGPPESFSPARSGI